MTEVVWPKEARPRLRRKKDSGDGTNRETKARKTEAEMDGLCQPRHESSERQKMKSMTEVAGGELCLPQRPHNQVEEEDSIVLLEIMLVSREKTISECVGRVSYLKNLAVMFA